MKGGQVWLLKTEREHGTLAKADVHFHVWKPKSLAAKSLSPEDTPTSVYMLMCEHTCVCVFMWMSMHVCAHVCGRQRTTSVVSQSSFS